MYVKILPSINNFIGNILQVTESEYCTQNSRYVQFCDMVYFVPTLSLFAGPVTNSVVALLYYNAWVGNQSVIEYLIKCIVDVNTFDMACN